jgi:hypothetical protein
MKFLNVLNSIYLFKNGAGTRLDNEQASRGLSGHSGFKAFLPLARLLLVVIVRLVARVPTQHACLVRELPPPDIEVRRMHGGTKARETS